MKTPTLAFFILYRWHYGLVILLLCLLSNFASASQPTAFSHWAKTAKIAGAPVSVGMSAQEIDTMLDKMVKQGVTVAEADSDLSNYQSDAQFELELALMKQFADAAHKRGLRVVWYFPALEVITINGKNRKDTLAKLHPEWVQLGLNGQPNVFYGGGGQVFWVPDNAESAWMSPSSKGYRNYFFTRVQKMVTTGIDGLWADVPIYSDFGPTKWSGFNPEAVTRFTADTGLEAPKKEDWTDTTWKRWVQWRHEELARFLKDLTQTARSINPEFTIFAETLSTDYNGGTVYGLDGSYLKNIDGLTEVWEVDSMSNNSGMRNARNDDWISFIAALKYTRGATGDKPSWVFSYGKQPDDAQQVMTQILITGNNPYELQVPEMASSVGDEFRARLFNWSNAYSPYLFNARSDAKTAILSSSASRDYVDKFSGLGMFATTEANGDDLWWSSSEEDSMYQRDYVAEHRGILKILVNEHIPFNVLVSPNAEELKAYQSIFLPNIEAISDKEASLLREFVKQGGTLVITGPNPTGLNQYGEIRDNYALSDLLGFSKTDSLPIEKIHTFGAGQTHYYQERLGKQYLVQKDKNARATLSKIIRESTLIDLSTDADDSIHIESSHLDGYSILQFANFIGLDGQFSIQLSSFKVYNHIAAGKKVTAVYFTNPDTEDSSKTAISFTQKDNIVSFDLSINQYAMVIIEYEGAIEPVNNHVPVAGDDHFQTGSGTALSFTKQMLLANDGDLDNDPLTIVQIDLLTTSGSKLSSQKEGYTYTPAPDFSGVDTLMYTLSDGKSIDTAFIDIEINTGAEKITTSKGKNLNTDTGSGNNSNNNGSGSNNTGGNLDAGSGSDSGNTSNSGTGSSGSNAGTPPSITTISNPIDSDLLTIDANLDDWKYLKSFGKDGDDIQQTKPEGDWLEAWMAHDNQNLYIAYRNDGEINQKKWWQWAIYLDTDSDKSTGFKLNKNMAADYFFNGGSLWKYTGKGKDWSWKVVVAQSDHKVNNDIAELSVPRHLINMKDTIRVAFQVDNLVKKAGKNISIFDHYPNQKDSYFNYRLDMDKQPMAYHSSMSVGKNTGIDFLLTGKDPMGKPLNYKIVTQPKNGQLTGMAAARRYMPNKDFIGKDSFRFKVNNAYFDSAEAVITIIVTKGANSNQVTDIKMDGKFDDWKNIKTFIPDPQDISAPKSKIDWIKAQLAHSKDTLYLSYENHHPIDRSKWWLWESYLDVDNNKRTGYSLNSKVGAEYVVQGNTLFRYTGSGSDWQWKSVRSLKYGLAGKFAEIAIPRKLIDKPKQVRIAFFGNNATYVDKPKQYPNAAVDFYPEQQTGYFQYLLK